MPPYDPPIQPKVLKVLEEQRAKNPRDILTHELENAIFAQLLRKGIRSRDLEDIKITSHIGSHAKKNSERFASFYINIPDFSRYSDQPTLKFMGSLKPSDEIYAQEPGPFNSDTYYRIQGVENILADERDLSVTANYNYSSVTALIDSVNKKLDDDLKIAPEVAQTIEQAFANKRRSGQRG